MPGAAKSDIKLGFFIGIGLLLLGVSLAVVQFLLVRARSTASG
jgi:hypothetical protein